MGRGRNLSNMFRKKHMKLFAEILRWVASLKDGTEMPESLHTDEIMTWMEN